VRKHPQFSFLRCQSPELKFQFAVSNRTKIKSTGKILMLTNHPQSKPKEFLQSLLDPEGQFILSRQLGIPSLIRGVFTQRKVSGIRSLLLERKTVQSKVQHPRHCILSKLLGMPSLVQVE